MIGDDAKFSFNQVNRDETGIYRCDLCGSLDVSHSTRTETETVYEERIDWVRDTLVEVEREVVTESVTSLNCRKCGNSGYYV